MANINILMISVAYQGMSIPILWTMLPKRGNSNTQERRELVQRFLDLFGQECIEAFLADREFIGDEWFETLIYKHIPFYIRIRGNMWLTIPGKQHTKAAWLFNSLPLNTVSQYHKIVSIDGQWVYVTGMKVLNRQGKIEFVIIATFKRDPLAMSRYKDRWQIEIFFKTIKQNLKIKSFLGTSRNAILSQIWVAMIAYLLLSYMKFLSSYQWTINSLMKILPTLLFSCRNLWDWLNEPFGEPPPPIDNTGQLELI